MTKTLAEQLEQRLREADFWRPLDRSRVECFAGGRRFGVGKVPNNRGRVGQVGPGLRRGFWCLGHAGPQS